MMEVNKIYQGDCLAVLKTLPGESIDSCVTDPPYGLNFMNKHWDYDVPKVEVWKEVLRVLKPGGHLLCACGTRTQHRMAVNIEDAGFEIRDVITWHYGSGFPKSLNVADAIAKREGAKREGAKREGAGTTGNTFPLENSYNEYTETENSKQYEGWGTALKPATEFWTLARKPLSENTVAENVLKHGTGGINIDESRILTGDSLGGGGSTTSVPDGWDRPYRRDPDIIEKKKAETVGKIDKAENLGRFPANVIFDEFTGKILDEQTGTLTSGTIKSTYIAKESENNSMSGKNYERPMIDRDGDTGGASRFFYCPKADNFERNKGLKGFDKVQVKHIATTGFTKHAEDNPNYPRANTHPTVKPIDLMRYLVKLITPKKGICLDPYCGSGTTLIGCKLELINYIGIEMEADYCKIAEARVAAWNPDKYKPQTLF